MSGIRLLLDSNRGHHIPKVFVTQFDLSVWENIHPDDVAVLADGESESYWDIWHHILQWATHTDDKGNVWSLYQDGDLWAVCPALMGDEEYYNFYGEEKATE